MACNLLLANTAQGKKINLTPDVTTFYLTSEVYSYKVWLHCMQVHKDTKPNLHHKNMYVMSGARKVSTKFSKDKKVTDAGMPHCSLPLVYFLKNLILSCAAK